MFCNTCLNNGSKENTCLVCRAPCSMMKLVPDMNQEIQDYFTEPEELIKKCCEVFHFQRQHRRRLLSYLLQSTKKFYRARSELQRMTEVCQQQHKQLKEYQKIIKVMESQLASGGQKPSSPFNIPISPNANLSPGFIQTTPTFKRTAKSTPYNQPYHSSLVTPARISKQRSACYSGQSQRSNTSNKISSTVLTPPTPCTPESAGSGSLESGYLSSSPWSPVYCSGNTRKCPFKKYNF
ncbi:probable E3 SUMO-protein ligase RNF212 [Aricia agestis]|uniref:probable E3 SUMO-protein ligase RNF212 n=1 Tax=Aricia agestis TaxID=91739 RepID=UPI001C203971|nr:probable E3 SUMO-protein ligase RNF212 [Aricia agestis]